MTFNSNVDAVFGVKVSFGEDIRRATCQVSYEALQKMIIGMYSGLSQDTVVLKYQDEDGDKITMSTDEELREAISLVSNGTNKVVRLFVETKQAKVKEEPGVTEEPPECWRGSRRGRFGWHGMPYGFSHPCHYGRRAHAGHAGFGHGFHHRFSNIEPPTRPVVPGSPTTPQSTSCEVPLPPSAPCHVFPHPPTFGCGSFFPVNEKDGRVELDADVDVDSEINSFKEKKRAMKETIAAMKAAAITDEDWEQIKTYKKLMKDTWRQLKYKKKCDKHLFQREKWGKKDKKEGKHQYTDRLMAKHMADVTIPDHSDLPANTPVVKTWRLKNIGMGEWPVGSQLILVSKHGDTLQGPSAVPVGAVQSGQEVEVSVPFVTPGAPGRYVAYYRMATADGAKFGQRVWVTFLVTGNAPNANPNNNASPAVTTTTTSSSMVM